MFGCMSRRGLLNLPMILIVFYGYKPDYFKDQQGSKKRFQQESVNI
jgi:hypothetical protein